MDTLKGSPNYANYEEPPDLDDFSDLPDIDDAVPLWQLPRILGDLPVLTPLDWQHLSEMDPEDLDRSLGASMGPFEADTVWQVMHYEEPRLLHRPQDTTYAQAPGTSCGSCSLPQASTVTAACDATGGALPAAEQQQADPASCTSCLAEPPDGVFVPYAVSTEGDTRSVIMLSSGDIIPPEVEELCVERVAAVSKAPCGDEGREEVARASSRLGLDRLIACQDRPASCNASKAAAEAAQRSVPRRRIAATAAATAMQYAESATNLWHDNYEVVFNSAASL